jgi:hypothetical protein
MGPKRSPPDDQSGAQSNDERKGATGISLSPLTLDQALAGAMATGKPPELPKGKRTATKRRIKGENAGKEKKR